MDTAAGLAVQRRTFSPERYEVVDGFFIQSSPSFPANDPSYDPLLDSFGLIDKSPSHWSRFQDSIERLNAESGSTSAVKVFFLARHGQGYHNAAETKYGTPAWDSYWSKLNGDGEIVWGPDALLTPLGRSQARRVHDAWLEQDEAGVPLPQSLYSSPLSRAAETGKITWEGILHGNDSVNESEGDLEDKDGKEIRPVFKEKLRETLGVHTCDERRSKSYLRSTFPAFIFEPGFAEQDELWKPDYRETDEEHEARIREQLDEIFASDPSTYVAITAHGGTIQSFLRAVGHQKISVPPGGMVPVVVRATTGKSLAAPPSDSLYDLANQAQTPFFSVSRRDV
ncbi:hypothetical protein JCM6882_001471 [Rhodosporidiobolus microsporus]